MDEELRALVADLRQAAGANEKEAMRHDLDTFRHGMHRGQATAFLHAAGRLEQLLGAEESEHG